MIAWGSWGGAAPCSLLFSFPSSLILAGNEPFESYLSQGPFGTERFSRLKSWGFKGMRCGLFFFFFLKRKKRNSGQKYQNAHAHSHKLTHTHRLRDTRLASPSISIPTRTLSASASASALLTNGEEGNSSPGPQPSAFQRDQTACPLFVHATRGRSRNVSFRL